MRSTEKYLKDQNRAKIRAFLLSQILLCVALAWGPTLAAAIGSNTPQVDISAAQLVLRIIFSLVLPIVSAFFADLPPPSLKAVLVFWRVKHVLPGHRAFSQFMTDPRIDAKNLTAQVGTIPESPTEQNRAWYKLLKQNESVPEVEGTHRDFLLWRDLTAVAAQCAVVMSVAGIVALDRNGAIAYAAGLLIAYVGLSVVARVAGGRLVANVLAVASTHEVAENSSIVLE